MCTCACVCCISNWPNNVFMWRWLIWKEIPPLASLWAITLVGCGQRKRNQQTIVNLPWRLLLYKLRVDVSENSLKNDLFLHTTTSKTTDIIVTVLSSKASKEQWCPGTCCQLYNWRYYWCWCGRCESLLLPGVLLCIVIFCIVLSCAHKRTFHVVLQDPLLILQFSIRETVWKIAISIHASSFVRNVFYSRVILKILFNNEFFDILIIQRSWVVVFFPFVYFESSRT